MATREVYLLLIAIITSFSCNAQTLNGTRDPYTDTPTSMMTNMIMTSSGPEMSVTGTPLPSMGVTLPNNGLDPTDQHDGPIPLYIMGLFPITSDNFHRGPSARIATQLAIDHINDREDILAGYEIKMNWIDTKCNAGVGTQALFEYVNSNTTYHMLLGAGCSAVAQTVSLAADLWNIVQVSYSASSPALSQRKQYKSFFRTNAADSLYNYARLAIIKRYGWKKVATLHENQEVFSTTINHFSTLLNDNGIELITSESFTVDPAEQISNLKEKGAWIIFGNFYENMARRVFCEAYQAKLYGKNYAWVLLGRYQPQWWTVEDNTTDCTPDQIYMALEGYLSTENIPLSIYPDETTVSGYTPTEYQSMFNERVEQEATETNTPIDVNPAAASYAYDATWSIALALNQSTDVLKTDPNMSRESLEKFTYGDIDVREVFMNQMSTLEYDGVSGPVSFTETGDREGLIEIRQLRDHIETKIGLYSPQESEEEKSLQIYDIQWQGGEPPKDETTERIDDSYIPSLYIYIAIGLCGLGMALVLICFGFTFIYRMRSCVLKAEPRFLYLLLAGCSLLYTSIVLLGLDRGSIGSEFITVCKITSWTLTIGFSCSFGVIFAKIYRAHKLLVSKANLWKPGPHGGYIMLTIAFFLVVDVIVLVVWTAGFPMKSTIQQVSTTFDEYSNTQIIREVEYCNQGNSVYFIVGLCVFHGLSLLLGAFLSYETRELNILTLNDTFWTGIAIYCVVTLSIVSAPLSFILANDPRVAYAVVAGLTWAATTLTLLVIFVPKFVSVRGTLTQRRNSQTLTDDQIYEEEVDEETKLRHKIDDIDNQIAKVKSELERRQNFGRQAFKRGCGWWCFGLFLGCNCGDRSSKVTLQKGVESSGYDNRGLDVSDINIEAGAGGTKAGNAQISDTPPTEPIEGSHEVADRTGSGSSSSSSNKRGENDDQTEMNEKNGHTGDDIIEVDSYNTKL